MSLRAHLTPTLVAVAVTSALVGGGTAYGITTAIDGHRITTHSIDAWKLTPAAQTYLRGPGVLGTVPSGKTLKGAFWIQEGYQTLGTGATAITFQQPFSQGLAAEWVPVGTTTANCPGSVSAPTAAPGHFCAYLAGNPVGDTNAIVDPAPTGTPPAMTTGKLGAMLIATTHTGSSQVEMQGDWAATAP